MKKSLFLIITLLLGLLLLFSCKADNGTGNETPTQASGFFGEGKQFRFVTGEGVTIRNEMDTIYKFVRESTKKPPYITTDEEPVGDFEIVIGNSNRDISKRAYHLLDRYYTGINNECVWIIYVKDNSACIAFDSKQALNRALEHFEKKFLNDEFGTTSGVVAYESFDSIKTACEDRIENQTNSLEALESKLGTESVEALKLLYSQYDEALYLWIANLWCPDTGAFYYSNSGRDTEGFLPDIESTKQILGFLTNSGMLANYSEQNGISKWAVAMREDYPEVADKILNFAINLQAEDGYFYHPQWKDVPLASRLGRDLGSAKTIINNLQGTPKYPYPDQIIEDSEDELTGRLGMSSVVAVSKVISTSTPAYLTDLNKWASYIDSLGIDRGRSYPAGNTLSAQKSIIRAAGQEYVDYLMNYLNSKLYDNGTWDSEISYGSINGLMKLSVLYESFNVPFPKIKEAANACIVRTIDTTPKPDGGDHVCDAYNPWYALAAILRIAKNVNNNIELRDEIRQMIYDNLADMINSTYEKITLFKKADGSFSYYWDRTSTTSQGSVVAVSGSNEGDVNATTICSTGLLKWIFDCIGIKMVPIFYPSDLVVFMDTIYSLASVEKDEAPDPIPETFDEFIFFVDKMENGSIKEPSEIVSFNVRDKEVSSTTAKYKWSDLQVTDSPDPRNKDDKAIQFSVLTEPCSCDDSPCTCKRVGTTASSVYSVTQNGTILGNTYVAEFDYYLDEWSSDYVISQVGFVESIYGGSSMSLNISTYVGGDGKNYLRIWDNAEGLDGMKNSSIVSGLPVKEWVRMRFELYKTEQLIPDEESGEIKQYLANVCKIYVNGEYVGESDAAAVNSDGTTQSKNVNAFNISGYRHTASTIYLDNILVYRTDTDYVCEEEPGNSVLDNMAVDKTKTVATFNDGKTATYYLKNLAVPGYITYSVKEMAGKTALYVNKYATPIGTQMYTQATLSNPSMDGECYTYETKIYYDGANMTRGNYISQMSFSASTSRSFLGFNLKFYGSYVEMQHNGNFLNGSSIETKSQVIGIDDKPVHLPVDQWFTFKIEFYRAEKMSESQVKIYIGDQNGENMELRAEFNAYGSDSDDAIERFLFTHYRSASSISVYLDDISFLRSNKAFDSSLPDEHIDEFDAGYVSGDVRISDNTAQEGYSGKDIVSAGTDPNNAENNVLKIESFADSATPYRLNIKHSGPQITNGLSAFETKIFFESVKNGDLATLAFSRGDGTLQEFRLVAADGFVYLTVPEGHTSTSNAINAENSKNRISVGEWHTLRIEFTNSENGAQSFTEVLIDGSSIGKFVGYKSTKNVQSFEIYGASAASSIYLDDVSFREYLLPKSPSGDIGADELTTNTEGESFDKLNGKLIGDGTDSTIKFGKKDGYNLTQTQPDDTIIIVNDPTGSDNKVLMFTDGSSTDHSTVWVTASGTRYAPNADKYVITTFETKLFIETPKSNSAIYLAQLYFTSGQSSRTSMNLVGAKKDGVYSYAYLSLLGSGNTKNRFEFNKWYTLRIEYHNGIEGTTLTPFMEIFINGESIGQKEVVDSNGTVNYKDVNGFFWKSFSSGYSTVYFDNMSLIEKQMDYPEAPEEPVVPEEPEEPEDSEEPDAPVVTERGETFDDGRVVNAETGYITNSSGTKTNIRYYLSNTGSVGTQAGDSIEIVDDPDSSKSGNKVLKFTDGSASSYTSVHIDASPDLVEYSTDNTGNKGVKTTFETLLYIEEYPGLTFKNNQTVAQPMFTQGGRSTALSFNITYSSDYEKFYLGLTSSETGAEMTTTFSRANYFNANEWVAIRFEWYQYDLRAEEKAIIKLYINDVHVADITPPDSMLTAIGTSDEKLYGTRDVDDMMWKGLSESKAVMYFDNISMYDEYIDQTIAETPAE